MTEIVYSREVVTLTEGQVFQNPRFFAGPVAGADSVVVHGDWPDIITAYLAAGVPVTGILPQAPAVTHAPAPGEFGALAEAFIAACDGPTDPVMIGQTFEPIAGGGAGLGMGHPILGGAGGIPHRTRKPK